MPHAKTPPLPPAEVEVSVGPTTTNDVGVDVSIKREGANRGEPRNYHGDGKDAAGAVKDVIKKIFDDPMSGEFHR